MIALGVGVLPAASASRGAVARADPTDSPSPTATATDTPTPTPSPTLDCGWGVLKLPPDSNYGFAYGPGSSVFGTTTLTNTSAYTFVDVSLSIDLYTNVSHPDRGAPPTAMWSLDAGAWQPIANLTATAHQPPSPDGWYSDDMPLGDLRGGVTHTLHFWLRFGPGVIQSGYIVQALINVPACQSTVTTSQVLRGMYVVQSAPPGHVSVPAAAGPSTIAPPVPQPTPSPIPTPTDTPPPISAGPVDASIGPATSGWGLRRTGGLAIGLVLGGLGARMGLSWWLIRRRLL
jgi:hypothetical protein